jgi:FlgN protein
MDKQIAQLEVVMADETQAHERLIEAMDRKLQALRTADHQKVFACCDEENRYVQRIGELEKQRLLLVAELTRLVAPTAPEPMRLAELAERLGEPARGRLLVRRQQLRERIEQAQKRAGVARRAAEMLVQHMQGLIRVVGGAMTGIGLYGRTGAPPQAAMAVSTINTTA